MWREGEVVMAVQPLQPACPSCDGTGRCDDPWHLARPASLRPVIPVVVLLMLVMAAGLVGWWL